MKRSFLLTASLVFMMLMTAVSVSAQTPVKWNASVKMTSKSEGVITLTATIDKGWHVYGFNQDPEGPVSTTVTMSTPQNVTYKGKLKYSPKTISVMDDMFGVQVTYWENTVTMTRKFKISGKEGATVTVSVNYMACNDSTCQPPQTETFTLKIR